MSQTSVTARSRPLTLLILLLVAAATIVCIVLGWGHRNGGGPHDRRIGEAQSASTT